MNAKKDAMINRVVCVMLLFLTMEMVSCNDSFIDSKRNEKEEIELRGSSVLTQEQACNLVKLQVLQNDTLGINMFVTNEVKESNDSIESFFTYIPTVDYPCWFFFIDDKPTENWAHSCRYVYVSLDGNVEIKNGTFPPNTENFRKVLYTTVESCTPVEPFSYIAQARSLTKVSNKYALIINGGADKENNNLRYWNNCSAFYTSLIKLYGYNKLNIKVLMSDGTDPSDDRNLNNGSYDSSPLDLDNDGVPDITGNATYSSVYSTLENYATSLTETDDLTIFITSHGGMTSNGQNYFFSLWNSSMTDSVFASLLDQIKVRCLNVVLTTCNSGGFIDVLKKENRNIYTACRGDEYSYGGVGNSYDKFAYYWISGISGYQPDNNKKVGSDYNNDNIITYEEAFRYKVECYNSDKEHTQFSSIPQDLGSRVSLDSYDYGKFSINDLPHFNLTGNYYITNQLPVGCVINWDVTTYAPSSTMDDQPLSISKKIYNTPTLTLNNASSAWSEYYEIKANISTPNGMYYSTISATSNVPSPYVGSLYWETDKGQNSITTNIDHGNTLYVSGDFNLKLEYTDKAGNKSRPYTTEPFRFTCVTSTNRHLQGETSLSFHTDDCADGRLYIYAENDCGRAANPFIINCEITSPYYWLGLCSASSELIIKAVNTVSKGKALGSVLSIKSIEVYNSSRKRVYAQNSMNGVREVKINTDSWVQDEYYIYISDGNNIEERMITYK